MVKKLIYIVVAIVFAFLIVKFIFSDRDASKIRKMLRKIEFCANQDNTESIFVINNKASTAIGFLKNTISVKIPEYHINSEFDKNEVRKNIFIVKQQSTKIKLSFEEINISFFDNKRKAIVDCDAFAVVSSNVYGDTSRDSRIVSIKLEKIDGDWLIYEVSIKPILHN